MASSLDKLANAPTSSKMVMLVLVMGLIGAGWWMLYFSDAVNAVSAQQAATPKNKKDIKDAKAAVKEYKVRKEQVDKLRQIEQHISKKLPKKNVVSELLDTIHSYAVNYGLEIRRFERREPVEKESYIELPVSMELVGTYKQITDFFEKLGDLDQIVNVGEITLSAPSDRRNEDGTVNDKIVANCILTTFKYRAAQPPPEPKKKKKTKKKGKK